MLWAVRGRRNWHCVIFFSGPEDETVSLVSFPKSDGWDWVLASWLPEDLSPALSFLSQFAKVCQNCKVKKGVVFRDLELGVLLMSLVI